MADTLEDKPLILKKKKKIPAEGHGGAWKIAYADFVTAMMAFFLLLWLLNATTEEQMEGISDFFAPVNVSEEKTGIGEALKGLEVMAEGALRSASARPKITTQIPTFGDEAAGEESGEERKSPIEANPESGRTKTPEKDDEAIEIAMAQIQQSLQEAPELAALQESLLMTPTPEGLDIQILDQRERSMFEGRSDRLTSYAKRLLALVGSIIAELPNDIAITGHTDGSNYRSISPAYTKWELTADQAAAAQRWLVDAGLPLERFQRIVGRADTELLDTQEPDAPRNRRISILLLREPPQGDNG
ncbi:flagellar motor protein MotB [Hwanghaeella sp.]|uniref:flagellar motor protein MotB n=1 Tax=Hwanghaeella sp. TaxID=2605943 RepID=UPI003CCBC22B